jgi:glycosyltransferase involved in cell wall biosynthesis
LADLNTNTNINDNVNLYLLSTIENGQYLKRLGVYFKSIVQLKKLLHKIQPNKVILTNTDILLLLILNRIKRYTDTIIMEISDIPSYTFGNSLIAKVQRYMDNLFLSKYVSKMIYTSPKFYDFYYKYKFKGDVFILENKPFKSMLPSTLIKKKSNKTIIGIVGLLQYINPYKALFEVIEGRDDVEVYIYGKGTYQSEIEFYAQKYNNIKYFGAYNFFEDIASIYSTLDMVYISYDTTLGDRNMELALPNKLYEAMAFKVPIIATKDTYLAQRVEKNKIGYVIECCNSKDILESIEQYKKEKDRFSLSFDKITPDNYIADNDYKKLIEFI